MLAHLEIGYENAGFRLEVLEEGEVHMTRKKRSGTHTKSQQKHYERVARLQYGPDIVNESIQLWNSYTKARQEAILEESGQNYAALVNALKAGVSPHSSDVQSIVQRWHENLRYFYEPTLEILRGLGEAYRTEPGFVAFFEKLHPRSARLSV